MLIPSPLANRALGVLALSIALSATLFVGSSSGASPSVDAYAPQISQWTVRNAPMAPPAGLECGSGCNQLWFKEQEPRTPTASSRKLWDQLRQLGRRTQLWPSMKNRPTTKIGIYGATAYVGWRIGSGIYGKFLSGQSPAVPEPAFARESWSVMEFEPGSLINWFSYLPAPAAQENVWYLVRTASNNGKLRFNAQPAGQCNRSRQDVTPSGGFSPFAEGMREGACFYYNNLGQPRYTDSSEIGWAIPESELFAGPPRDLKIDDNVTIWIDDLPTPPPAADIPPAVTNQLNSGVYPELNEWVRHHLGEPDACDPLNPSNCNPQAPQYDSPFPRYREKWLKHKDDDWPVTLEDEDEYRKLADDIANGRYALPVEECTRPDGSKIFLTDDGIAVFVGSDGRIITMYPPGHSDLDVWFTEKCNKVD